MTVPHDRQSRRVLGLSRTIVSMATTDTRSLVIASALVSLAAVAAFACSSFSEDPSQPVGDASVPETSADGSVQADAAIEAGGPFCVRFPAAAFCADFDDEKALPGPWTAFEPTADDGVAQRPVLDSTTAVSGKSALATRIGPLEDGMDRSSTVVKLLAQTPSKHAHYEFALRIVALDAMGGAYLAHLGFGGGGYYTRYKIWLNVEDGIGYLAQERPVVSDGGTPAPPLKTQFKSQLRVDQWQHVAIDVDFASGKVSATLDGELTASADIVQDGVPGPTRINTGIDYVDGPQTATDVRYDNVLLTLE
jgi:hypothetical protein